jgi:chromosome segregation ATPase
MNALREELPMEDNFMLLEPRVARIEGEVAQLNSRLAGVEVDLRDFRKSADQKLDKLDAKLDVRFERQDARLETVLEKLDARFKKQDERFERQDARLETVLEKLDARLEKQDERFERRDARLETAVHTKIDGVDAKIDRVDLKFDSRLESLSTRRFTLWVTLMSAAATMAAAVLAVVFSAAHGH